jgi:hypothetical protein
MTIPNELDLAPASVGEDTFKVFSTDSPAEEMVNRGGFKLRKAPSLFNVITGPRGSLKTLLLTMLACKNLLKCFYLRHYNVTKHVWTNYPIGFFHRSVLDGKVYYLKPEPLNMESLYTFDQGLASGWVYIDEIDQWYDRQDWAAVTQKLTNAVITQIRKRELSLSATTQNFQWLNARAQFQTDTLINCREAAFTAWGRKMGLKMGVMSFLTLKDLSGVNTGYKYDENFRTYNTRLTHGERCWDKYDTNFQFDPMQTKARYKIKTDAKTITLGAGGYKVQQRDELSQLNSRGVDSDTAMFSHIMEEYKDQGLVRIPPSTVWAKARELGWQGDIGHGGRIISSLGFARNSNRTHILINPDVNESQDGNTPKVQSESSPRPKIIKRAKVKTGAGK